ncbi:hypothetical protein ALC60_05186, partial [Trachymyrmex zeteki]
IRNDRTSAKIKQDRATRTPRPVCRNERTNERTNERVGPFRPLLSLFCPYLRSTSAFLSHTFSPASSPSPPLLWPPSPHRPRLTWRRCDPRL